MKNLLALFLMIFLFTACEGPMGPPGKDGNETWWYVSDPIKIESRDWEIATNKDGIKYYFYDYKINDLDAELYDGGTAFARIFLDFETNIEAIAPLEHTMQCQDDKGNKWNEIYGYEYYPGHVLFTVKFDDFIVDLRPPTHYFQVVLNY